ncbi:MAG: ABC transporter permease, partial [Candidatus Fimimonas sp.]
MKQNFTAEHRLYLKKQKQRKILVHTAQIGVLVLLLGVWELAATLGWIDSFITSSPSRIAKTLGELVESGTLLHHAWVSTLETLVGFLVGTVLGYVAAVILWWNNFLK